MFEPPFLTKRGISEDVEEDIGLYPQVTDRFSSPKCMVYCYALVFNIGDDKLTVNVEDRSGDVTREVQMSQAELFAIETKRFLDDLHRDIKVCYKIYKSKPVAVSETEWKSTQIFVVLGMQEDDLLEWAQKRDADLKLDVENAVMVGRQQDFPLAMRTYLKGEEPGENGRWISLDKWKWMYAIYRRDIDQSIYMQYPIQPDCPSAGMSPVPYKVRCSLLYEKIVADREFGGGGVWLDSMASDTSHPLCALFPLHNACKLKHFEESWLKTWRSRILIEPPLDEIHEYFNESIGFYFAFLQHYQKWLRILILPMLIAQFLSFWDKAPTFSGMEWLLVFVVVWSVCFVDYWKRREKELMTRWGLSRCKEKCVARPTFEGIVRVSHLTGKVDTYFPKSWYALRRLTGCLVVFFLLSLILASVAGIFYARTILRRKGPYSCLEWSDDSKTCLEYHCLNNQDGPTCPPGHYVHNLDVKYAILLGVVNAVQIAIYNFMFSYIATILNEWENHRTHQLYDDALIVKSFGFKFVNSFISLFYLAYLAEIFDPTGLTADGLLLLLRLQLASLFITALLLQNFTELFLPGIMKCLSSCFKTRPSEKMIKEWEVRKFRISIAERQFELEEYPSTLEDMSEIIIQYGYVTLFVLCFPAIPVIAFISNIVEMKIDAHKLIKQTRRPIPTKSQGLGTWVWILELFCFISVVNNAALFVFISDLPSDFISKKDLDTSMRVKLFCIVAFGLFFLLGMCKLLIPNVPDAVINHLQRQKVIEDALVKKLTIADDCDTSKICKFERCCFGLFQYTHVSCGCIPWLSLRRHRFDRVIHSHEKLKFGEGRNSQIAINRGNGLFTSHASLGIPIYDAKLS